VSRSKRYVIAPGLLRLIRFLVTRCSKFQLVEPPHQILLIDPFRWRFLAVECLTGLGQNAAISSEQG
jgi:hypothetical protein